ncbi:alpha/beta fold hydrolase [Arthrobacter sp. Z1-15]
MTPTPFVMEFDHVGEIAFRELNFAPDTTNAPLKPGQVLDHAAPHFSPFQGEPFSLVDALPHFSWPTVVISGDHDIRTPQMVAKQVSTLIPDATLLTVRNHGHSALDTHPDLALEVTRTVADSVHTSRTIDAAALPSDPHGARGLMHRLVTARLHFATYCPSSFS